MGTTISIVIANIFIMNIYYHKKMKLNMFYFWKNIIVILPSLIIPTFAGFLISLMPLNTVFELVRGIILLTSIYFVSVLAFGLNKKEREAIRKVAKL